jgi:hypothetical protein
MIHQVHVHCEANLVSLRLKFLMFARDDVKIPPSLCHLGKLDAGGFLTCKRDAGCDLGWLSDFASQSLTKDRARPPRRDDLDATHTHVVLS